MAWSIVQQGDTSGTASPTSITFSAATAGNTLLCFFTGRSAGSSTTPTSPSGWTDEASHACGGYGTNCFLLSSKVAAGGETSWTPSAIPGSSAIIYMLELSGLTSSPVDQVASSGPTTGVSISTGTTGTTSQASELAFAFWGSNFGYGHSGSGQTYSNSFTYESDAVNSGGGSSEYQAAYKELTATGTVESTFSYTGSNATWYGSVAALKISGGSGPITVNAGLGSYGVGGKSSPLTLMIPAKVGSYSYAGTASPLSTIIPAGIGSYAFNGVAATFGAVVNINAGLGTFTYAGANSPLSLIVGAGIGAYDFSGVAASIAEQSVPGGHFIPTKKKKQPDEALAFRKGKEKLRSDVEKAFDRVTGIEEEPVVARPFAQPPTKAQRLYVPDLDIELIESQIEEARKAGKQLNELTARREAAMRDEEEMIVVAMLM